MAFFYEENPGKFDGDFDPKRCNATKCYLKHYENSLVLTFFENHGTTEEKNQAQKENAIARRKMTFWQLQENFNGPMARREVERLNKRMAR